MPEKKRYNRFHGFTNAIQAKLPSGQKTASGRASLNPWEYEASPTGQKPGQEAPAKKCCGECGAENFLLSAVCVECGSVLPIPNNGDAEVVADFCAAEGCTNRVEPGRIYCEEH